jgi:hypothetical protein
MLRLRISRVCVAHQHHQLERATPRGTRHLRKGNTNVVGHTGVQAVSGVRALTEIACVSAARDLPSEGQPSGSNCCQCCRYEYCRYHYCRCDPAAPAHRPNALLSPQAAG